MRTAVFHLAFIVLAVSGEQALPSQLLLPQPWGQEATSHEELFLSSGRIVRPPPDPRGKFWWLEEDESTAHHEHPHDPYASSFQLPDGESVVATSMHTGKRFLGLGDSELCTAAPTLMNEVEQQDIATTVQLNDPEEQGPSLLLSLFSANNDDDSDLLPHLFLSSTLSLTTPSPFLFGLDCRSKIKTSLGLAGSVLWGTGLLEDQGDSSDDPCLNLDHDFLVPTKGMDMAGSSSAFYNSVPQPFTPEDLLWCHSEEASMTDEFAAFNVVREESWHPQLFPYHIHSGMSLDGYHYSSSSSVSSEITQSEIDLDGFGWE